MQYTARALHKVCSNRHASGTGEDFGGGWPRKYEAGAAEREDQDERLWQESMPRDSGGDVQALLRVLEAAWGNEGGGGQNVLD
jgi:hypothetical protein